MDLCNVVVALWSYPQAHSLPRSPRESGDMDVGMNPKQCLANQHFITPHSLSTTQHIRPLHLPKSIQSLGKWGDSFTYMVNEETLAFFSHCEDKRQDKNVTCLHVNPCRLLRNGPLCHGPNVLYQPR